jgi:hypothetical protein
MHTFARVAVVVVLLVVAPPAVAATVQQCGSQGECICIYWVYSTGEYLEKRCPGDAGIVDDPATTAAAAGEGTWTRGTPTNPSTAPGTPLAGALLTAVDNANASAVRKTHGDRIFDEGSSTYYYVPNECSELFDGSEFNDNGSYLLRSYIQYRDGEGVESGGRTPCSEGAAAWTTLGNHSKYVFICPSFLNMTSSDRTARLIHEALHVAGQREDEDSSTLPPSDNKITTAVKEACGP